jgi:hypothetical protein
MANHSEKNIAAAVQILKNAKAQAELEFANINRAARLTRRAVA